MPALKHTRTSLIAALRAAAASLGKDTVTGAEFRRHTRISLNTVHKVFGGFRPLVAAAGLKHAAPRAAIGTDELFDNLRAAIIAGKGRFAFGRRARVGRHHFNTYKLRWGSWLGTLRAFLPWLEIHDPKFKYMLALRRAVARGDRFWAERTRRGPGDTRLYGRPFAARPLLHEPVNEQGVVFLFGVLAAELGFTVETIGREFPDCLAKRRVDTLGHEWSRVRIEFEHQSRDFKFHRHDPRGCDLIVCWEHNWPECGVEVLELKSLFPSF